LPSAETMPMLGIGCHRTVEERRRHRFRRVQGTGHSNRGRLLFRPILLLMASRLIHI